MKSRPRDLWIRLNLVQKLVCIFAAVFLIFFVLTGILTDRILDRQLIENMENSVSVLTEDQVSDIEVLFRRLETGGQRSADAVARWLNHKPTLRELATFDTRYQTINGALRTNLKAFPDRDISGVFLSNRSQMNYDIKKIIIATAGRFDAYAKGMKTLFFNMYLITRQQLIRIYPKDWALKIEPDHDFTKDTFYFIADPEHSPDRKARWTAPYYDSIWKHWMISLITPIYVHDAFLGIVGHDYILDALYKDVLSKKFYRNGYGFIFDEEKNIVVHPQYLDRLRKTAEMGTRLRFSELPTSPIAKVISQIVDGNPSVNHIMIREFQDRGKRYYLFASRLDFIDWYYAIVVPYDDIAYMLPTFERNFVIEATAATLILFSVIVLIIWIFVLSPITALTSATHATRKGNLGEKVCVRSHDEIGNLATAFNDMTDKLKQTVEDLNRDITERKRAEDALKASHETFLTVLEGIDATIYVADMDTYEILFMNKQMKDTFGSDLVGQTCWKAFRDATGPCPHCTNDQLLDSEGHPAGVRVRESKNALTGRWFINHDRAIQWVDGRLARLQIATDITKIKELEEERIKTQAQLIQAQKVEAIGTLAGGIAHDFNNLMMGMMGNLSLILYDMDASHTDYGRLKNIEKQITCASRLTKQLLGYARKGNYEVKPVDLNQVILESSDAFGRTRKEIRIHRELDDQLFTVEADQGQIEQVLLNLYVNAADAMQGGGDLFLETRNANHEDMRGQAFIPRPGDYVLFKITDTGIGMDQYTRERIFDPFFTTKEMGRGTGLGLASVFGIVKAHAGYILVDSEKGAGTTFSVYLPGSRERLERTLEPVTHIKHGNETVLLVDDEDIVLEIGSEMLKGLGYHVLQAAGGREALDICRNNRKGIDLVILDMIMPGIGGSEVYDELSQMDPHPRCLLSSGYSIDGQARQILDRGCDDFIQKPFGMQQLSSKIREILDRGKA
jgi:two-component system, cell cycle sensor histidine kinase and response regulator CckA